MTATDSVEAGNVAVLDALRSLPVDSSVVVVVAVETPLHATYCLERVQKGLLVLKKVHFACQVAAEATLLTA